MVKRMTLLTAASTYIYPKCDNIGQQLKTECVVMKIMLFRYFNHFQQRHWVHTEHTNQQRQHEEADEKAAEDLERNKK